MPPANGRWRRGSVVPALYFADSEETTIAESKRLIHELGAMPEGFLPREFWTAEINERKYVDLRDPERALHYGMPVTLRPTRADWPNCQPIGERIAAEGNHGLIAASAAQPAGATIVVFPAGIGAIEKTAARVKTLERFSGQ